MHTHACICSHTEHTCICVTFTVDSIAGESNIITSTVTCEATYVPTYDVVACYIVVIVSFTCTGHSISSVTRLAGAGEAARGGIGAGGLHVAGTWHCTLIDV